VQGAAIITSSSRSTRKHRDHTPFPHYQRLILQSLVCALSFVFFGDYLLLRLSSASSTFFRCGSIIVVGYLLPLSPWVSFSLRVLLGDSFSLHLLLFITCFWTSWSFFAFFLQGFPSAFAIRLFVALRCTADQYQSAERRFGRLPGASSFSLRGFPLAFAIGLHVALRCTGSRYQSAERRFGRLPGASSFNLQPL